MRTRTALFGIVASASSLSAVFACSLSFNVGPPDAGADAGDAGIDAPGDPGEAGSKECPTKGGPMVRAGSFCIDATEVTVAEYQRFVTEKNGDMSGQIAVCTGNATYKPTMDNGTPAPAPRGPEYPVIYVDWCDAHAFCRWAGKRLCGRIGGGPAPFDAGGNNGGEWVFACSQGGAHTFPYGDTFNEPACNNSSSAGVLPPRSKAGCQGGFPGLFDMNGNVDEWEDACNDARDVCRTRGGSYDDTQNGAGPYSCVNPSEDGRTSRNDDTGFRCCGDPQ